jgi:small subunit ribosomal protein S17
MTTKEVKTNNVTKQRFSGVIVSDKMKDTAVVEIKRYEKHQKYHKFMMRRTKLMAHNPNNERKIGEKVTIEACRPLSKNKSFKIIA